jgi:hypothetical protein
MLLYLATGSIEAESAIPGPLFTLWYMNVYVCNNDELRMEQAEERNLTHPMASTIPVLPATLPFTPHAIISFRPAHFIRVPRFLSPPETTYTDMSKGVTVKGSYNYEHSEFQEEKGQELPNKLENKGTKVFKVIKFSTPCCKYFQI